MTGKRRSNAGGAGARKERFVPGAFDTVPSDVTKWILSFLTETKDALSARRVCKHWDGILMKPRPTIARVESPRKFLHILEALCKFHASGVPLSLSKDALFTTIAPDQRDRFAEIEFSVETERFVEETNFTLPVKPLLKLLKRVEQIAWGEEFRIALFHRFGRVAVVYSGTKERRFSTELVDADVDWNRLCDVDYRLKVPLDTQVIASLRGDGNGDVLMTARTAPVPRLLREDEDTDLRSARLLSFTLEAGFEDPQINYYFVEHAVEDFYGADGFIKNKTEGERALFRVGSKHIGKSGGAEFENLFAVIGSLESLRWACRRLRKIRDVKLCIPSESHFAADHDPQRVPLFLEYNDGLCKMKWAIAARE